MATFTVSISNRLKVYGPGSVSLWGDLIWGSDVFGSDQDTDFEIGKSISNSITLGSDQDFISQKVLTDNIDVSGLTAIQTQKNVSNTLLVSQNISSISVIDNAGYARIEVGVSALSSRIYPSYTANISSSVSYVTNANVVTQWGNA